MKLNLLEKLKTIIFENKNPNYKSIAEFLINNINLDYKEMTIFSLAKKTNTSAPTITRFCNKIGVDGYKELVFLLKDKEHEVLKRIDDSILKTPSLERHKLFSMNVKNSLEESHKNLQEKLDNVTNKILKANKIYLFGLGTNTYLIKMFSDLLIRMNYNVIFSEMTEQQMFYSKYVTKNDFVLFVSVSLSDPIFEKFLKTISKNALKENVFFLTRRKTAKTLIGYEPSNILEIGRIENNLGMRYFSGINILFILNSILINLFDKNIATQFMTEEI